MIQTGVIHHLQNRMDGACLRVVCTIYQTADASMNCRSRAHGAGFNCSKQFAVDEPVVTDVSSRLAQGHDFSMSGWIVVGEVAIPSSSNHAPFAHHDGPHRNFACFQRTLGAAEGLLHPKFVRGYLVRGEFVQRRAVFLHQWQVAKSSIQFSVFSLKGESLGLKADRSILAVNGYPGDGNFCSIRWSMVLRVGRPLASDCGRTFP